MNASWTKCLKGLSYWDCESASGVAGMGALLKRQNFRPMGFEDDSRREADLQ
jgi:hypothetical protein